MNKLKRVITLLLILTLAIAFSYGVYIFNRYDVHTFPSNVDSYDISDVFNRHRHILANTMKTEFPKIEEVTYDGSNGKKLYAWLLLQDNPKAKPTFIYFHGAARNIESYAGSILYLACALDVNVFACDYPGTGQSEGGISLRASEAMVFAAYEYLSRSSRIAKDKIVFYGFSMGAHYAWYGSKINSEIPIIVESGVTNMSDFTRYVLPFKIPKWALAWHRSYFNNNDLVKNIKNPKLVIHGSRDTIVRIEDVQKLIDIASEPKQTVIIENGSHGVINFNTIEELMAEINIFLESSLH